MASDLTLNTTNGAIKLVPQDGSGTQTLNIGRQPNLGKVLQAKYFTSGQMAVSAGVTADVWQMQITKLSSTSRIYIHLDLGYSYDTFSSTDTDERLYFRNSTTSTYIVNGPGGGSYVAYPNNGNAFFGTDTNNQYGTSLSSGYYQYYQQFVSATLVDTTAPIGVNNYILSMTAQSTTFRLGRWSLPSISIMEIEN